MNKADEISPQTLDNTPANNEFDPRLDLRHKVGRVWLVFFLAATAIGIIALGALMYNIVNGASGYAAIEYRTDPESLAIDGTPIEDMNKSQLAQVLEENVSAGLFRQINREKAVDERSESEIYDLILERVLRPKVRDSYSLVDSVFKTNKIREEVAERYPNAELKFVNWLTIKFITSPQSSDPLRAGVRTAILGSLYLIGVTVLFSFPIGVGAAIYLQEYANPKRWINRVLQTNISNLAGVPSIIYGMLGLAVFVRALEPFTSGALFGQVESGVTANGRTIISAGLTMGLLILPVVIINAQEAIKAVPGSLREASYGLGATKWQTVWSHVLPNAMPGILTGTILAISRAIGETAPLVVVGASTFISFDPTGPFSKFTALPIQIYQWTARPQPEFRNIAAAAILVLLLLLLTLNATAILLRNRFSRRY